MIRKVERADGTTRYEVYGRNAGRKVYVGSYDSQREAEREERQHKSRQEMIADGESPPEHDTKKTVKEATDAWLKHLESSGSRSRRPYGEFVKYQILPTLENVAIAKVTDKTIRHWRDATAKSYAGSTVNSALGCLSSAFSWFVDEKWLGKNPCEGVEQIEIKDRSYNWIRTRPELERLLLACSDELRDMVAIAVGTMMRIDELLHLHWDDVDLEGRLITVQRGRQGTTKSGKIRHVPILDTALAVFKRRALKRDGSPLVFPGKKGAVRTRTPVTTAYKTALKRAQLDTTLRWHDLRHTGASWWVLGCGDIFRLSRLMGHANVKITQKVYAHLAPEAWAQDYHRLSFHVPTEPAKIYELRRDARGKLAGRNSIVIDARVA